MIARASPYDLISKGILFNASGSMIRLLGPAADGGVLSVGVTSPHSIPVYRKKLRVLETVLEDTRSLSDRLTGRSTPCRKLLTDIDTVDGPSANPPPTGLIQTRRCLTDAYIRPAVPSLCRFLNEARGHRLSTWPPAFLAPAWQGKHPKSL